jgi:thiamine transport system ATP-binding protein
VVHRREHVRLVVELGKDLPAVDAIAPVTADVQPGDRVRLTLDADGIALLG